MIVIKFGGSSISSSKNIEKSLRIINNYKGNVIVFFSAFGGITNLLLECGKLASLQNKEYLNKLTSIKNVEHFKLININFEDTSYRVGKKYATIINTGFQYIQNTPFFNTLDYIGILDCDVFPEINYYSKLTN